jgi:hypothetical protein
VRTQRELAPDARGTDNATESSVSSVRAIDDVKYAVERVFHGVFTRPLPGLCLWPRCLAALPLGSVASDVCQASLMVRNRILVKKAPGGRQKEPLKNRLVRPHRILNRSGTPAPGTPRHPVRVKPRTSLSAGGHTGSFHPAYGKIGHSDCGGASAFVPLHLPGSVHPASSRRVAGPNPTLCTPRP